MSSRLGLLDERNEAGDFRARFGELASNSSEIDVALTRVRLSLVDLRSDELSAVRCMRVLLAHVSALRLALEAESVLADPRRASNLRLLIGLLGQGRIVVRSSPLGGWSPDFSVFSRDGVPQSVLVGVHSFLRPSPFPGPLFVSEHGAEEARAAGLRFEEVWGRSHDVSAPIRGILEGLDRLGTEPARNPLS